MAEGSAPAGVISSAGAMGGHTFGNPARSPLEPVVDSNFRSLYVSNPRKLFAPDPFPEVTGRGLQAPDSCSYEMPTA